MILSKGVLIKLCLLALQVSECITAPVMEPENDLAILPGDGDEDTAASYNNMDPAVLDKRVSLLGSRQNPIDMVLDIERWADLAKLDCWAMLCGDRNNRGNRIYQRVLNAAMRPKQYQKSGASFLPFQVVNRAYRGVTVMGSDPLLISAEEWPPESTMEGGEGANVWGVPLDQQNAQSNAFSSEYNSKIPFGQYFRVSYNHPEIWNTSPSCRALFKNPPDTHLCDVPGALNEDLFGHRNVNPREFGYHINRSGRPFLFDRI